MAKIVIGRVLNSSTDSVSVPGVATEATLLGIKTGTDKIPASPAQEHVTPASFHAVRISNGTGFINPTTPAETQPVNVVAFSAASQPLPAGAATEATLATRATESTLATRASEATLGTRLAKTDFEARINTLGQKPMAGSTPVVLPSDQKVSVNLLNALATVEFDAIQLLYTGANLTTALYKTGGLAGTTVLTLTLAYTGSRLDSVVRTIP